MATLLSYSFNTSPNPLTVGINSGIFSLLVGNDTGSNVTLQGITICIKTGTGEEDLTNDPNQIRPVPPSGWKMGEPNVSQGQFTFVFIPSSGGSVDLLPSESLIFNLNKISIANKGVTSIVITEGTNNDPTKTISISKFPAGWGQINFSALPPNIEDQGDVVLSWNGPLGATYTIQYMNIQTGKITTLPVDGAPPFTNSGTYPGPNDPKLTIDRTTVFTLIVKEEIEGNHYFTQISQTVTVYVPPPPPPEITSFTGSWSNELQKSTIDLTWTSEHADHVEGNWTAETLDKNPPVPIPINPPFLQSYSVTAIKGDQKSKPKSLALEWSVINTIGVGNRSLGMALTPDNSKAFVTNFNSNTVSVIDLERLEVIKTIKVSSLPVDITMTPNGEYAIIDFVGSSTISILSVTDLSVYKNISIKNGTSARSIVTPDSSYVLVPTSESEIALVSLDTFKITKKMTSGSSENNVANLILSSDGKTGFYLNQYVNSVFKFDVETMTPIKSAAVGSGPVVIVLSPDEQFLYCTNSGSGTTSKVNVAQMEVVHTFRIDNVSWPGAINISPNGKYAIVANDYLGTFSLIDLENISDPIKSFGSGNGNNNQVTSRILFSPDGQTAFIVAGPDFRNNGFVWVFDIPNQKIDQTVSLSKARITTAAITNNGEFIFVLIGDTVSVLQLGLKN